MARILRQPARCRTHGAGAGEIFLAPEIAARVIIGHVLAHEVRRACPARIGPRLPRIALMAALVIPGSEINVIILAARLEEMWVIGNQLRHHTLLAQLIGNGIFPKLDRAPGTPEKIERTPKNVVTGGYAGKRAGEVAREARGAGREAIEIWRRKLHAAISAQHMPVEAVEQDHDSILRHGRRCGFLRFSTHLIPPINPLDQVWRTRP